MEWIIYFYHFSRLYTAFLIELQVNYYWTTCELLCPDEWTTRWGCSSLNSSVKHPPYLGLPSDIFRGKPIYGGWNWRVNYWTTRIVNMAINWIFAGVPYPGAGAIHLCPPDDWSWGAHGIQWLGTAAVSTSATTGDPWRSILRRWCWQYGSSGKQ